MLNIILSTVASFASKKTFGLLLNNPLLKNWRLVVIMLAVGIILYQNVWTGPQFLFGVPTVHHMTHNINVLRDTNVKKDVEISSLKQAISTSNKIIDEWKNKTEALAKQQERMSQQMNNVRKQHTKELQTILQEKAPQTCEEAFEYLKKGVKELQW